MDAFKLLIPVHDCNTTVNQLPQSDKLSQFRSEVGEYQSLAVGGKHYSIVGFNCNSTFYSYLFSTTQYVINIDDRLK